MSSHTLPRLLSAALILTACLSAPAQAAPAQDEVLRCLGIIDNSARLSCYDRTVPTLRGVAPAAPSATPSVPAPPAAPATPRVTAPAPTADSFGASRLPGAANQAQDPEAISATLTGVREVTMGKHNFTLDNGQVWTQVVAREVNNAKAGKKVRIEKALFGSYTMTIDDVAGIVKVRRVK